MLFKSLYRASVICSFIFKYVRKMLNEFAINSFKDDCCKSSLKSFFITFAVIFIVELYRFECRYVELDNLVICGKLRSNNIGSPTCIKSLKMTPYVLLIFFHVSYCICSWISSSLFSLFKHSLMKIKEIVSSFSHTEHWTRSASLKQLEMVSITSIFYTMVMSSRQTINVMLFCLFSLIIFF